MFHIHKFGPWQVDYQYIDTSWGEKVPSTAMVRFCQKCHLPKKKHLYGTRVRTTPPQLRGQHAGDSMLREHSEQLKQRLHDSADENGRVTLDDATRAVTLAVIAARAAESEGFAAAIGDSAGPGSALEGIAQQLKARASHFRSNLDTYRGAA